MFSFYRISTGEKVGSARMARSPKKAWEYFMSTSFPLVRDLPDGTRISTRKDEVRKHFVCRSDIQREPAVRLAGHSLSLSWSGERGREADSTGTCSCGHWEESCSSQVEVRREYRHHLKMEKERLEAKDASAQ